MKSLTSTIAGLLTLAALTGCPAPDSTDQTGTAAQPQLARTTFVAPEDWFDLGKDVTCRSIEHTTACCVVCAKRWSATSPSISCIRK